MYCSGIGKLPALCRGEGLTDLGGRVDGGLRPAFAGGGIVDKIVVAEVKPPLIGRNALFVSLDMICAMRIVLPASTDTFFGVLTCVGVQPLVVACRTGAVGRI